jgi:hypothetical protein
VQDISTVISLLFHTVTAKSEPRHIVGRNFLFPVDKSPSPFRSAIVPMLFPCRNHFENHDIRGVPSALEKDGSRWMPDQACMHDAPISSTGKRGRICWVAMTEWLHMLPCRSKTPFHRSFGRFRLMAVSVSVLHTMSRHSLLCLIVLGLWAKRFCDPEVP